MKKLLFTLMLISIIGCQANKPAELKTKIKLQANSFDLEDVKLLDSPFKRAMQLNRNWLLDLKPDRFLYQYRLNSGLAPKDSSYGGWENIFSGQTFGHYLSACAMMCASSGEDIFKERVNYIIDELDTCQKANGNGYVGGVRTGRELFAEIKSGDIRVENGFNINGRKVPWYIMHKLFAGLIDAYLYAGNEKAGDILIKLSDWTADLVSDLSEEEMQRMLISEHGGINESLATVYAITGDMKYLDLAKRFNHKTALDPLAQSRDELDGKHANSLIPKVIGALEQFELGGDSSLFKTADFFWRTIVNHHSYVIGGNAEQEHLGPPDHIYDRITDFTNENCGTYNMLKLTKNLFCLNPSVEKADYYERALYNQILASQNPETGMVSYFNGLAPGYTKHFCSPDKSFWCCTGTGFENHTKYGEAIYFKDNQNGLFINLFIPSELNWEEKGLKLIQETRFPFSDVINLKLNLKRSKKLTIKIRYPFWAENGFYLEINGKKQALTSQRGSYIEISRKWNDGDIITCQIPMSLSSENALGSTSVKAFLFGPIVLAGDLGFGINDKPFPVLVSNDVKTDNIISILDKELLQFNLKAYPEDVTLIPYLLAGDKTTVGYFQHYTPSEWEREKKNYSAFRLSKKQLEERSVDWISFGDKKHLQDHQLTGKNTKLVNYGGKEFLTTDKGGWFSFNMKVSPAQPMDLVCTYWGDPGEGHDFDIYIDERFLTNVSIHEWGEKFIMRHNYMPFYYHLKFEVTVTFKALQEKSVVPVCECRMITGDSRIGGP